LCLRNNDIYLDAVVGLQPATKGKKSKVILKMTFDRLLIFLINL
jgi:hypothetical protein